MNEAVESKACEPMEIEVNLPETEAATKFVSVPLATYVDYIATYRDMQLLHAASKWYGGVEPDKLLKLIEWCDDQNANND